MKNWIKGQTGNWVNLDYVTQIYVRQVEEKWHVIGEIAGKEAGWLLSDAYETEEEAKSQFAVLTNQWIRF